jgi:CHAT domain-containing protein/Tfp pilus assembly protein PilF
LRFSQTISFLVYPFEQQRQARELGIRACREAIELAQIIDDKPCQAMYQAVLGSGFAKSRQLAAAERSYTEALEIYRRLAAQEPHIFNQDVATTLNNLGTVQSDMGKRAAAEKSYTEALDIRRTLAAQEPQIFNQYVAMTLNNLGTVQSGMGKRPAAEKSYTEALDIYRRLAAQEPQIFNQDVATTLNNLGTVQSNMGNRPAAEKSYTEALDIRRTLAAQEPHIFNQYVAMTLNNLGNVQRNMGKRAAAEKSYTEALDIYRTLAAQEPHIFNQYVAGTLNNLGYLQLEENQLEKAEAGFNEAKKLIDGLRDSMFSLDEKAGIFQENANIYRGLLSCYIRMPNWKKALEIAELGKSRTLSELLNLKSEDLQPKAPTPDTVATVKDLGEKYSAAIRRLQELESIEKALSEQLSRLQNAIKTRTEDKNDDQLDDETRSLIELINNKKQPLEAKKTKATTQRIAERDQLNNILAEINNKYDPDFPPKAQDITSENIFAISRNLNKVIVMFRFLQKTTAIIYVFPNGELHIQEIENFGHTEMFELFRDKWLTPYQKWKDIRGLNEWKTAISETLKLIYEKLIVHVDNVLRNTELNKTNCKNVHFVPSASLAMLPLHAAYDNYNNRYFLEDYTVSYSPSISVLKKCKDNEKAKRTNKTLFVTNTTGCNMEHHKKSGFKCIQYEVNPISSHHLPSSENEVEFIGKIFQPNKNLLRNAASKSAVTNELNEDYSFLHFSCHGNYDMENPFASGLKMSDDKLTLTDIINSNLRQNWLTTLSACETGMVDFQSATDEHFGLPLGFIFAGSPSVWASLWSVGDYSTSELMKKAYENLNGAYQNNKPEALRQAQLEILKNNEFKHPFNWAGFQHFGV